MQPSLFASVQWTVSTLTKYVRDLLESDEQLQDVWVKGELSNLSRPASGHIYFTLKDAGASLRSVMWRTEAGQLRIPLQEGMAASVHGRIGVYEINGQYQLYADQIRPAGEGALYQEFLRLKALLEAEGLFDPVRKRPIPDFPRRIGLVTSGTGAALRDMLSALRRRLPLVEVVLSAAPVQGDGAPAKLVEALEALWRLEPRPEVILVGRGGGSIEDLWAFNDERLVRAVAASPVPVICGVGHETDFTLCDFAADLRAPTPTAAAEMATPVSVPDLAAGLQSYAQRLNLTLDSRLAAEQNSLSNLGSELKFFSPLRRIQSDRQRLDELARRGSAGHVHRLALEGSRLEGLEKRLEALNPAQVLGRGYAIVTRAKDGALIRKAGQAKGGERIRVRVSDGEFDANVVEQG